MPKIKITLQQIIKKDPKVLPLFQDLLSNIKQEKHYVEGKEYQISDQTVTFADFNLTCLASDSTNSTKGLRYHLWREKKEDFLGKGLTASVYAVKVSFKYSPKTSSIVQPKHACVIKFGASEHWDNYFRQYELSQVIDSPLHSRYPYWDNQGIYSAVYMEERLVTGANLFRYFDKKEFKQLSALELLRIAIKIIEAMESVHQHDVTHGDVRPENIMLDNLKNPQVTIIDLGLGTIGAKTQYINAGCIFYIAPEAVRKETNDALSDTFSCGRLLAELFGDDEFILTIDMNRRYGNSDYLRGEREYLFKAKQFSRLQGKMDDILLEELARILNLTAAVDRNKRFSLKITRQLLERLCNKILLAIAFKELKRIIDMKTQLPKNFVCFLKDYFKAILAAPKANVYKNYQGLFLALFSCRVIEEKIELQKKLLGLFKFPDLKAARRALALMGRSFFSNEIEYKCFMDNQVKLIAFLDTLAGFSTEDETRQDVADNKARSAELITLLVRPVSPASVTQLMTSIRSPIVTAAPSAGPAEMEPLPLDAPSLTLSRESLP